MRIDPARYWTMRLKYECVNSCNYMSYYTMDNVVNDIIIFWYELVWNAYTVIVDGWLRMWMCYQDKDMGWDTGVSQAVWQNTECFGVDIGTFNLACSAASRHWGKSTSRHWRSLVGVETETRPCSRPCLDEGFWPVDYIGRDTPV